MFFIIGISQKQKKLDFSQLVICPCCGSYGQVEIFMIYTYLMLFFIPVWKWNKRYYATMSCCGEAVPVSREMGEEIVSGRVNSVDIKEMNFTCSRKKTKRCENCRYETEEDFKFCPKCGHEFRG